MYQFQEHLQKLRSWMMIDTCRHQEHTQGLQNRMGHLQRSQRWMMIDIKRCQKHIQALKDRIANQETTTLQLRKQKKQLQIDNHNYLDMLTTYVPLSPPYLSI